MSLLREFQAGRLSVKVYGDRTGMGRAAAGDIAAKLRELLREKEEVNVIFAAAPSQNEMLEALAAAPGVAWERVNAFHMDEYAGLPADAPQGFGNFLRDHIFSKLPFRSVQYLNGNCADVAEECRRYGGLLDRHPADVVCLGIGENGHIAFNDPAVADFGDPVSVKEVELDSVCRAQQVHDGCFARLEDVPTHALTLTVPALMRGGSLFCVVPAATKAEAVRRMLTEKISEGCPAGILRIHAHASLYLDRDSAGLLPQEGIK